MPQPRKYRINPETLMYEIKVVSRKSRFFKIVATTTFSLALAFMYFWFFVIVLGQDLPKTTYLKRVNAKWASRMEVMNRNLNQYEAVLEGLQMRDENVYRSIFGMNDIPSEIRNSGIASKQRYAEIEANGGSTNLKKTAMRLDRLAKMASVQSKSFDEVATKASRAGDMASCIPAIVPMMPGRFKNSSAFGYRADPMTGSRKMHTGMDFSCPAGNPVYATGGGIVESVKFAFFGYGNCVTIDHGFGYKTRYAHLKTINVAEGMKVQRGDQIAESGNSGRSTGAHLHYEVLYKDAYVNPINFLDLTMPADEYATMVRKMESESQAMLGRQFSLGRGRSGK